VSGVSVKKYKIKLDFKHNRAQRTQREDEEKKKRLIYRKVGRLGRRKM